MTILPVTTSAEIQPWKGNPWEGSTFEGEEEKEEWGEKEATDQHDPELLEKLKEEGLGKEEIENIKNIENLESIKYTDPEPWEFLTNGNEVENYFKRVGIGLKDTFVGLWEGTNKGTRDAWDYVSSGEMWSDTKGMASESFRYFTFGEVIDNFNSKAHYHLSGQSWEDLKGGLSSAWDYTSNIGSYLFSKQSVSDLYGYFTSGEVLMDYAEDFEAFSTGVDPESQQKISGGARFLAAGSILIKPLKIVKKLDDVGNAVVDTVKKDKGDENSTTVSNNTNYILFNKTHKDSMPKPKGTGPNGGRLQSHHGLQKQWALENLKEFGYNPNLAPTIIETGKGFPHTKISNLQNFRRNERVINGKGKWSSTLQDGLQYIVNDLKMSGYSRETINGVLNQQYKMLDKLGIKYERIDY
jgi:hypothetical protein